VIQIRDLFARRHYDLEGIDTRIPGHWCQSGVERATFWLLKRAEQLGLVEDVVLHPRPEHLGPAQHNYRPDIRFVDVAGGRGLCWVEAKGGLVDATYMRNLKDWAEWGPGPLLVFHGSPIVIYLKQVLIPATQPQGETHGSVSSEA
jgi:hypothetical protein